MKSIAITLAAYSFATATFFAAIAPANNKTIEINLDAIPAATGIMLEEVVISSLPTCTLPEITVSTKKVIEYTLPEVVIIGEKPKA